MTAAQIDDLIENLVQAAIDREHAQTAYRRSANRSLEEAREAVRVALSKEDKP